MKLKNYRRMVLTGVILVSLVFSVGVFAQAQNTAAPIERVYPLEILAQVMGKTVEEVWQLHINERKTAYALASEAGVLDEFKAALLSARQVELDAAVSAGTLTQAQADAMIALMQANQDALDTDGNLANGAGFGMGRMGKDDFRGQGLGQGMMNGQGLVQGLTNGRGRGRGLGQNFGQGACNCSCLQDDAAVTDGTGL